MSNSTSSTVSPSASGPTSSIVSITSIISSSSQAPSTSEQPTTTSHPLSSSSQPVVTSTQGSESVRVSVVTATPSDPGATSSVVIVVKTSQSPSAAVSSVTDTAAASSATSAAASLQTSGSEGGSSNHAGTIVPAVVVPVVAVALLVLGGIWFFRKRRANKEAEEARRKELEDYGYNPNTDPGLGGATAGTTATNDNAAAMSEVDGSGYRGWGTTNTARKASTTLGSTSVGAAAGAGAIGVARSDSGGNGGYQGNGQHSPSGPNGAASASDHNSGDPLVHGGSRPISQDFEGVAALGSAPAAGSRSNTGVRRGPSNASSAYSAGQRSDTSGEIGNGMGSPTWGNEYLAEDGPYGAQGGSAPVIRDVSARRNTRIEQPTVMPQQARGGISQNF